MKFAVYVNMNYEDSRSEIKDANKLQILLFFEWSREIKTRPLASHRWVDFIFPTVLFLEIGAGFNSFP